MKILMISLDNKILDKDSGVAKRMVEYGKTDELYILIPNRKKTQVDLSSTVHVQSTGGIKVLQFFSLLRYGNSIIKCNNIDNITTQDPFFTGLAGYIIKKLRKRHLEVQLHGDFFDSSYYKNKYPVRYRIGKSIVRRADKLRVVSQRIKKSLVEMGTEDKKINLKPIHVDVDKIRNHKVGINLRKKYVGYSKIFLALGRVEKIKNINLLIDLFGTIVEKNNKILLLVVGDGSEKKKIKEKVRRLGLEDNIKFEGWTNDPISYIKTSDCLLIPSLSEGYGLTAMEASVAGTAVIMSDVGIANHELKKSNIVKIVSSDLYGGFMKEIKNILFGI